MAGLLCPRCQTSLTEFPKKFYCPSGHEYVYENGFLDLLLDTSDVNLINEEQHWNTVADQNKMSIDPSKFINDKIFEDYCNIYRKIIINEIPNYSNVHINIGEIGCGNGSAFEYFGPLGFKSAKYLGIDVSSKLLQRGIRKEKPPNWDIKFVRASANDTVFDENFFDIIFSSAALHHLNLSKAMDHISKSLKKDGMLILNEPSINNPFAKIGRNFIKGFHTPGEKPLNPKLVEQCAKEYGLSMVFEKGSNFINGSLQYLIAIKPIPRRFEIFLYNIAKYIDKFINSPNLSYNFIQVYKKV